uniref:Large ribosomal subunit protein uL5c n=1 Tax=Pterocladiophila hemisphaerica TaxID=2712948 RepID=A0A6M3WWA4_9FLOR|nr:ribosomal protein L5 [Pterocladiophila hemisphaerica]
MQELYATKIRTTLSKQLKYGNNHLLPKLIKITIHSSIHKKNKTNKDLVSLSLITGQQPLLTKAKKSISDFKLKKNTIIGALTTLRRKNMYNFLYKLIHLVLPAIKDFNGLNHKSFDTSGNYNLGLSNMCLFPELNEAYTGNKPSLGLNITIVTSAKSKKEALNLLQQLGLPFNI